MMRPLVLALLLLLAMDAGPRAAEPESELFRLYYDAEVLSFCGLATPAARSGFERRLAHLLQRDGWSEAVHRTVRRRAWVAGHREWNNRSLGGNKAWCDGEGRAALDRLSGFAGDPP